MEGARVSGWNTAHFLSDLCPVTGVQCCRPLSPFQYTLYFVFIRLEALITADQAKAHALGSSDSPARDHSPDSCGHPAYEQALHH